MVPQNRLKCFCLLLLTLTGCLAFLKQGFAGERAYAHWLAQFTQSVQLSESLLRDLEELARPLPLPGPLQIYAKEIPLPNSFQFSFTFPLMQSQVERILAAIAPIRVLEPNAPMRPLRSSTDPFYSRQWGLKNWGQTLSAHPDPADGNGGTSDPGIEGVDVGAEAAWDLTVGTPRLLIGVIDTGVDPNHPDLKNRLWRNEREVKNGMDDDNNGYSDDLWGWDLCDGDGEPYDLDDHGTPIASTLLASGEDGIGISGVLWEGRIVPVRFMGPLFQSGADPQNPDCNLTSGAIKGLDYLKKVRVHIINMSWGGEEKSTLLEQKISELIAAGIVLVAASGNDGVDLDKTPLFPAAYNIPGLIAVGAFTNDGKIASFSNYGSPVRVVAPGVNLWASSPALEDLWQYKNFNATPRPNGGESLPQGRITNTNFSITGNNPRFGKVALTSGDIALAGDMGAIQNYVDNKEPQGYASGISGILISDPVNLSAFGSGVLKYTLYYELDNNAEIVLEYSLTGTPGSWSRLPSGAGFYTNTQGKPEVVEERLDIGAALGYLPSSLLIRFRFTTWGTKNTITRVPGGFWLVGISWIKPGSRYDGSQGPTHGWHSGTSLAAPFVSGTAGLLLSLYPEMPPFEVRDRLVRFGAPITDPRGTNIVRLYIPAVLSGGAIVLGSEGNVSDPFGVTPNTIRLGDSVTFRLRILAAAPPVDARVFWGIQELTPTPLQAEPGSNLYTAVVTPPTPGTYRYSFRVSSAGEQIHGPFERERTFVVLPPLEAAATPKGCGCALTTSPALNQLLLLSLPLFLFPIIRSSRNFSHGNN